MNQRSFNLEKACARLVDELMNRPITTPGPYFRTLIDKLGRSYPTYRKQWVDRCKYQRAAPYPTNAVA